MVFRLEQSKLIEFLIITIGALSVFLPFLSIQYDVNGLVEAQSVESGRLFHKNHMLYRPIGFMLYRGLQLLGYSGRSILILQIINALCGALAVVCAYFIYKRAAQDRVAAVTGTVLLATSFTYWLFSTDAAYVTMAAAFAAAGMMFLICAQPSLTSSTVAGVFVALSILTWQATIFLVPAMCLLYFGVRGETSQTRPLQAVFVFGITALSLSGAAYILFAFANNGLMRPLQLLSWLSSYGEGGTLPMWGKWELPRLAMAAGSALRSVLPVPLAIPIREIDWGVQLGRVAVDLALVGFFVLVALSMIKARTRAFWFVIGYSCFIPFIAWWDPYEPKWFLVPNIFAFGFFACALQSWLRSQLVSAGIFACVLLMAATNFVTTIRPRHNDVGSERRIAQCVAGRMHPQDLLIVAEWGWPDYLEYLHERRSLNVINNFGSVKEWSENVRKNKGTVYITDPNSYSEEHIHWLESNAGVRRADLTQLAASPAFSCYGTTIFVARITD